MNQKYLQGISSNMESVDDAVFFEATAENISAFLFQHGRAIMSALGTTNEITFLTARMGIIDACPAQERIASDLCKDSDGGTPGAAAENSAQKGCVRKEMPET